jgi:hypothetical protein
MTPATPAPLWHKSRRSGSSNACVEVATNLLPHTGEVLVRDSKHPDGPVLHFTRTEWAAFLGGVHDGEFTL